MCCASLDRRAMARIWTLTRGGCQSAQGPVVGRSQSGASPEGNRREEKWYTGLGWLIKNTDGRGDVYRGGQRTWSNNEESLHEHATTEKRLQARREKKALSSRTQAPPPSHHQHHRCADQCPTAAARKPPSFETEPFSNTRRSCFSMVRECRLPCIVVRAPSKDHLVSHHCRHSPVIMCRIL